jgi:hypothetical protein
VPTTATTVVSSNAAIAITSVIWSGGETAPVITINGTGFGSRPAPDPPGPPSQLGSSDPRLKCIALNSDEGLDFGTQLYVFTQDNNFSAGRYRPSVGENDCVGFVVDAFGPAQIKVHLGAAYPTYRAQNNYTIHSGYHYEIGLKGTTFQGTVQYT